MNVISKAYVQNQLYSMKQAPDEVLKDDIDFLNE